MRNLIYLITILNIYDIFNNYTVSYFTLVKNVFEIVISIMLSKNLIS